MNKPIIGIVSKPNIFCEEEIFTQQIIYDGVRNAILKNGGLTIGILPTQIINKFCDTDEVIDNTILTDQEKDDLYNIINKCDGIILQGGLSSESYEIEAAKYAIDNDIPLLGICAGFNNIIRAMNGDVFVLDSKKHNQDNNLIIHNNTILKDTLLYNILKKEKIGVNSLHTMFAKDENIKNLDISAYSDDGFVEAIELKNKKFLLGVKWHPELMLDQDDNMNNIFKEFINATKK